MSLILLGHAHQSPRTSRMAGGRCGGPAPGAAEVCPGSRRDVLNAERDGGFLIEGLGDPLFAKVVPWHNQLATPIGHVALRTYFALCLWSDNQ